MRARRTMTGLALTAGLAVSMGDGRGGGGQCAERRPSDTKVVSHAAATTKAEQRRIEDYWTPARMKGAIPAGKKVDPQKGKPGGGTSGPARPCWRRGPAEVRQGLLHRGQHQLRVLRHRDHQHQPAVVTTAGHCVNEGPGDFVTNFAFYPAYNNGASATYGTWTAKTLLTTDGWATSGDYNVDVGFAVMNTNGRQDPHLGDR